MLSSFMSSLTTNIAKIEKHINDKCYKITIELFLKIVELTPSPVNPGKHAEGVLVNQWYPKEGKGFSDAVGDEKSPNGAASRQRIVALRGGTAFLRKNGRITLSNNVHYAVRAEKIGWPVADGWSGKVGPYRMVALALQQIAARYK